MLHLNEAAENINRIVKFHKRPLNNSIVGYISIRSIFFALSLLVLLIDQRDMTCAPFLGALAVSNDFYQCANAIAEKCKLQRFNFSIEISGQPRTNKTSLKIKFRFIVSFFRSSLKIEIF